MSKTQPARTVDGAVLTRPRVGSGERPLVRPPSVHSRPDDGTAFLPDSRDRPARADDDLAESLAEGFLTSATSAEESSEDARDAIVAEELGGPFITADPNEEFASGTDDANPADALVEAFPTAIHPPERYRP